MSYNEWLDIDVLEDYLDGKLDAKTMHKVEKLSLEDPFVAEALAGLSQSPKRTQSLSLLQKQLQERVAQKPVEEKRWRITSQRLSIAAAAAVLFVTVSILFWMKENNRQKLETQQAKKIDVNVAPQIASSAPEVKPTISPLAAEKVPTLPVQKASSQVAKMKDYKSTVVGDIVAPQQTSTSGYFKADTVSRVVAANVKAKEIEARIAIEGQKTLAAKKAESVRERPLPGKAEGIYVEANSNLKPFTGTINGKVYDRIDGQPIPGAVVKIAGTNKATTTNTKGEFTLPADSTTQSLSVAYLGYTKQEIKAQANQSVNVALEGATGSLNEVVLTGVKENRKKETVYPEYAYYPLGGWEDYRSYLINNNGLTKNGLIGKEVELKFEVKENGEPTKIKVVKSQGKIFDAEAIRLVKDGPKWVPAQQGKKGTAQVVVKF